MKHNSEQKDEDNFRLPVFWQTPCYVFALSPRSSTMWVCLHPQSVACALAQGRLFCKVGFCVWVLCALQMCLTWCGRPVCTMSSQHKFKPNGANGKTG